MKHTPTIGFADLAASLRKIKEAFFQQINQLIDWRPIAKLISRHYQKGVSATGRPSYEGLMLFKICLLEIWYGLSDYEVEDQVNDRISFSRFVGLSLDNRCPDHSVISRFRTVMTEQKAYDKLFKALNKQLEQHQLVVRTGAIVDASVTDSPRRPKGKSSYAVVEDRHEEEAVPAQQPVPARLKKVVKPGVDTDARWLIKAGKLRYGYKRHTATDERGMVLGTVTTAANESDVKQLNNVLKKVGLPEGAWVKADKGYKSAANDQQLKSKRLKNPT